VAQSYVPPFLLRGIDTLVLSYISRLKIGFMADPGFGLLTEGVLKHVGLWVT